MQNKEYEFDALNYIDEKMLLCNQVDDTSVLDKLQSIGYEANEQKKISFQLDPTVFAKYLEICVIGKLLETGDIALYRRKDGYYELVNDLVLGKIIMVLMSQCGFTLWKKKDEKFVLEAYKRILPHMVKQFDSDEIMNLKNGIFDLKTKSLLSHDPKYLCLGQIDTKYDPEAEAPQFEKFLSDISCGDLALARVMLELIAYCLTRSIKAAKLFFLQGGGANGKSVYISGITKIVGAHNVAAMSLSDIASPSKTFALEGLVGKYLNISAENEVDGKMKTENIKKLVTGDPFSVQRKYKNPLEMVFKTTFLQVVNTLPDVSDVSYGYWRRVKVIPFLAKFEGDKLDKNMEEKLEKELPGILNLAIKALEDLEARGYEFSKCEAVEQVTCQYENSQKPAWEFFSENYEVCLDNRFPKTRLYDEYKSWCKEEGKEWVSVQTFWKTLEIEWKNRGIRYKKPKSRGRRFIEGFQRKSIIASIREGEENDVA